MARLVVDVRDFAVASRTTYDDVGLPLAAMTTDLTEALYRAGGMAGDDPGGAHWAALYDRATESALIALNQVITGTFRLSSLFGTSGRNYAAADVASNAREQSTLADLEAILPPDREVGGPVLPPTACGAGARTPHGWHFVAHLIGYIWPDGHQDRLHAAARAWSRASVELIVRADEIELVPDNFRLDRLPEADDIHLVCAAMGGHLRGLSEVFSRIADACAELARHIDDAHRAVRDELDGLIEWTAAIEGASALFSIVTVGASEAVGQAAEALRIRATATAIGTLIARFLTAVRSLGATIERLVARADEIAGTLAGINGVRLTTAVVLAVRTLPGAVRLSEIAATQRLTAGARVLPHIDDPRSFDPTMLRGMDAAQVRAGIPLRWRRAPASRGEGMVFRDPVNRGRQIRIMKGYPRGSRPDQLTEGPYAVVSQNGRKAVKIPLLGNPTLP